MAFSPSNRSQTATSPGAIASSKVCVERRSSAATAVGPPGLAATRPGGADDARVAAARKNRPRSTAPARSVDTVMVMAVLFVGGSGLWIDEVALARKLFTGRTLGARQRRLAHILSRGATGIIRVDWRVRVHQALLEVMAHLVTPEVRSQDLKVQPGVSDVTDSTGCCRAPLGRPSKSRSEACT